MYLEKLLICEQKCVAVKLYYIKGIMIDSCFSHVCIPSSQWNIPLKNVSHLPFFLFCLFIHCCPLYSSRFRFRFCLFLYFSPLVRSVPLVSKLRYVIFISSDILEFSVCNVGSSHEQLSYLLTSIIQSHPDRLCSP
jgi:hypothetical protein